VAARVGGSCGCGAVGPFVPGAVGAVAGSDRLIFAAWRLRLGGTGPASGGPGHPGGPIVNRRRRFSEAEREQRHLADRERVKEAANELLSSEGWARWVRARQTFHAYSASNCMLIALQCHQRRIVPEHIAGFHTWIKLGRAVRKGENALRILAPITVKQKDEHVEASERRHVFFKTTFVFDVSQTDPIPGVEPAPLQPPCEPLTGDSHAHLLAPLVEFAASLGYAVAFQSIPGATGGWCDLKAKQIAVDADVPANAQVRTLVHEVTHALGVDYVLCRVRHRRYYADPLVMPMVG